MPTVREQISDQVLALLEADADVQAFFTRTANRTRTDRTGWLMERIAKAPNDFPRFSYDFSRGRHGMWTKAMTFAADDPDYHELAESGCDTDVERTFDLTLVIRDRLPPPGEVRAPEEPILAALFKAGTRLGLPNLVDRMGEATWDRRDTRPNEDPKPGVVTTVRLPIFTRQLASALLEESP